MAATESRAMMAPAVIKLDIMVEIATPSFLLTNGISNAAGTAARPIMEKSQRY